MHLSKSLSISLFGLVGRVIEVEADISSNLPAFVLVGLPDASVSESAARVRAACTNSGLSLPGRKITVNLSPASVPKQGSGFDLAIAISVLAAAGTLSTAQIRGWAFVGELALDGSIKPVTGILAATIAAKAHELSGIVVPLANLSEANLISGISVLGFDHLSQVVHKFGGRVEPRAFDSEETALPEIKSTASCYSEVLGQDAAIEALAIAAVGAHHLQMLGPPGAGKTMLASRFPSILPRLSEIEAIEVLAVRSISGLPVERLETTPPFQAPHHTASRVSVVGGGGANPKPGLISLAHNGVLFLDEAPEFSGDVLESLRQPLESGNITISRASGHAQFPARFQLILAANPCPCGYAIGTGKACTCSQASKSKYLARISGPLSDRIDIRLALNAVNPKLAASTLSSAYTSEALRARVSDARARTLKRLSATPWQYNSQVPGSFLRRELRLPSEVTRQLDQALERGLISMRGYDRCLRLAWSIADFEGLTKPKSDQLAEAVYLRGAEL